MRFHIFAGLIAFGSCLGVHAAGLVVAAVQPSAAVTALPSVARPTDTGPLNPTIVTHPHHPWPVSPIPSSTFSVITVSPSASAIPVFCPRDNNTLWTDHVTNNVYQVECGIDYYDLAANWNFNEGMRHNWEECAKWCAEYDYCLAFSYIAGIPLKPNCWLKTSLRGQTLNWNSWAGKLVKAGVGISAPGHDGGGRGTAANTVAGLAKETTTFLAVGVDTTTILVEGTAVTTAVTTVVTTELVKPVAPAPATTLSIATSSALPNPTAIAVSCNNETWWADEKASWRAIEYFCQGGHDGTFGGHVSDKMMHGENSIAAAYWPYNGTAVITSVVSKAGCTVALDRNLCMQRFRAPMYGCDSDVRYEKRGGSASDGCSNWNIHMQSWPSVGLCQDQDLGGAGVCATWSTGYSSGAAADGGLRVDWFPRG
ncbi:unnamed protein product [Sordaria macrospora k-hell]|uniref:WGS project CABT00000000 data, contig 2.20 n=1 Tax=Sordaria macrospora (strain ATCC MYA-333 / DSM 997 / K(L3346) / K-hell) TaxID=771870 RepID=F7W1P2_SORMK|nr:uncharacterized protein SMAC_04516 [Sordaria macrospora k-hell]CCC11527.1 unnamed protein product [Sordaria macrospora k-hell]